MIFFDCLVIILFFFYDFQLCFRSAVLSIFFTSIETYDELCSVADLLPKERPGLGALLSLMSVTLLSFCHLSNALWNSSEGEAMFKFKF